MFGIQLVNSNKTTYAVKARLKGVHILAAGTPGETPAIWRNEKAVNRALRRMLPLKDLLGWDTDGSHGDYLKSLGFTCQVVNLPHGFTIPSIPEMIEAEIRELEARITDLKAQRSAIDRELRFATSRLMHLEEQSQAS